MPYTLALKNLPFEPDSTQIIYIDGSQNAEVARLVEYNYFGLRRSFEAHGYDFCYIPYLKKELENFEKIHYNAPYAKNGHSKFITDDNFILKYMLEPEKRSQIPPSLLYYTPDFEDLEYPEAQYLFRAIPITELSFKDDAVLRCVLNIIIGEQKPDVLQVCEYENTEGDFDDESKQLIREVEERIARLREKGIKQYIIERIVSNNKRLSQLIITKQNKIILREYFMEVNMTPLPKAVYFLFLKHPEGIMFSYLPDYREELLEIYRKIKGRQYNDREARKSIWNVTDPLSNSINEKCSRIREAFVSQFDERFAHNYYVTGQRGEPKKILLPRDLVIWED